MSSDKMREIKVEKVTLNIGTGEPGDKLEKAMKLLHNISDMKPIITKSKSRIPSWDIRPGLEIACKVTLRKEKAEQVLVRLLKAIDNNVPESKFDNYGNFSFGIKEYIDIQDLEYEPDIGIIGLEAAVTLERPGYRIKRRRLMARKIPQAHRISKQEAIDFMISNFRIKLEEE